MHMRSLWIAQHHSLPPPASLLASSIPQVKFSADPSPLSPSPSLRSSSVPTPLPSPHLPPSGEVQCRPLSPLPISPPQVKFSADHSTIGAMQSMETEVVDFTGGAVRVTEQVSGKDSVS